MKLMNAGKTLLHLPSSNANLPNVLAQVEQVLSEVKKKLETSNLLGIHPEKKNESVTEVNRKRKRNLSPQKKQIQSVEYGENLVGSRIEVYWPQDKMYYQGVVESFNSIQKRHKILYDDGEVEILALKREKWNLLKDVLAILDSGKVSCSQSGLTCVQGYNVKCNVAPILKSIIREHGDIAAKCLFQAASVRESLLTVVCEIVRRIQANNVIEMKEIERDISDAEAANIDVSWLRAHLEAAKKRKEAMKESLLLMEMKPNIILVKRAAKMDLEQRQIKLVTALLIQAL